MRGGSRRSPGLSPWQPPLALISRRCLQARERAPDTFTELLPAAKPLPLTRAPRTASFSRDPGPVPNRTRRLLCDPQHQRGLHVRQKEPAPSAEVRRTTPEVVRAPPSTSSYVADVARARGRARLRRAAEQAACRVRTATTRRLRAEIRDRNRQNAAAQILGSKPNAVSGS